ncbi:kinase-like domain-containing protein [Phaeosphaeriaceae sp. PMI808]|nr:kinase-like domain-containing protein [Phaeosphaeriaceae sp. PMI808]
MTSTGSGYDLTTEHGLRGYLTAEKHEPAALQILTGGTANYVYRVLNHDNSTIICKHAAPYLQSNSSFALDPERMDFEAAILAAVPSYEDLTTSNAHAVQVHSYDSTNKLLRISDGGHQNLKEAYTEPTIDIRDVATNLANWLATLHTTSRTTAIQVPTQGKTIGPDNNTIAVNVYRYSYNNLHAAFAKFNQDSDLAHRINSTFGSLLATDNECLCHGDFWPGNVLVRINAENAPDLAIVDWEISRRGTSATDVGQFAAEAFLLDRFRGGRDMRRHFLDAYLRARMRGGDGGKGVGKEWVRRVAVHWAVHVAFWPTRVEWCDEGETRKLVDIGVEVMRCVLESDWEKLMKSWLFVNVQGDWEMILAED